MSLENISDDSFARYSENIRQQAEAERAHKTILQQAQLFASERRNFKTRWSGDGFSTQTLDG
jgi:hypothetical protein